MVEIQVSFYFFYFLYDKYLIGTTPPLTMENIIHNIHYLRELNVTDTIARIEALPDYLNSHPNVRLIIV